MKGGLFGSKSSGHLHTDFNPPPSSQSQGSATEDEEEQSDGVCSSTPFVMSGGGGGGGGRSGNSNVVFPIVEMVMAVLRKSLVTCSSVERDDLCSLDISWPTHVTHVSHVTFDRFNGFLGLPHDLHPQVPRNPPSASVSVFGVSAKSMQCSYDGRGNSVPTVLLMMQRRLYKEGGLKVEGVFRINAENSQEEYVRGHLNKGLVPEGIDVHCLAGLIKAWFRELPTGVLDSLTPEQVMHCNTEEDCSKLADQLPPMEAALLDWAINLMADVVQHERFNKMNARNIAMVFAPNMTQMADPLTALIHAVQVMNFLKTLILKTLHERADSKTVLPCCAESLGDKTNSHLSPSKRDLHVHASGVFLRSSTLSRLEAGPEEKLWSFHRSEEEEEDEWISVSGGGGSPKARKMFASLDNISSRSECDSSDWLSLRKGVKKLCRHPVFQFTKQDKKTQSSSIAIVNTTRERSC